ncbi:hypothetical protein ACJZ2D_005864 [Fusarium nematophilum]
MAKKKLVALNMVLFRAGMNDAAVGALIPYIQPAYNAGLLSVAIVYLTNFAGRLLAALTNAHITAFLGTGGTLIAGATLQLLAYVLAFWEPPYAIFCVSYFLSGIGIAYQDAQANSFVANLDNAHRWLGILHASFGVGALASPLAATALATAIPKWHYFYLVLLGATVLNMGFLAGAFWADLSNHESSTQSGANAQLKKAFSQKPVWILSGFFFLYVGAELTAGGWIVQFLITVRGGAPSQVGHVASGFWGGLALGRLLLADLTNKLGERRMIFVYILIGLVMELVLWLVPNIIANAIVISVLGFVIAPFFPAGLSILTKLLTRDIHVAAVGFTTVMGQAGSAAFPFLTGAVASEAGIKVLQPIMVGLLLGMFILWAWMPRVKKPTG